MLTHIQIKNFAIIDELNIELHPGMTVMTGETGAGKSIMIDALSLCMGDRADATFVREGAERADITVSIDISRLAFIQDWLTEQELDGEAECIVRRTITKDGRSRAYINGHSVPLGKLKTLAQDFIDIHSQHAHHALLKPETHGKLLDIYGKQQDVVKQVKQHYDRLRAIKQKLTELKTKEADKAHEMELLQFQIDELEKLDLKPNEWQEITQRHDKLSHAEQITTRAQSILDALYEDESRALVQALSQLQYDLEGIAKLDASLSDIAKLLVDARINCDEAASSLRAYISSIDNDPQVLQDMHNRISVLHDLSRKHRCDPDLLCEKLETLQEKFNGLQSQEETIKSLEAELATEQQAYQLAAEKLSKARKKSATALQIQITEMMQELGMPGGEFSVQLSPLEIPAATGLEQITFMVKTNAGQQAHPLHKVASGGELSRISLALQVTIVQDDMLPVIVFDEVDVGIGGGTAEIVGHLLRCLGQKAQVLCVTHLPQVAAQGDQHFFISKKTVDQQTRTQMTVLNNKQRIEEIARMLGGVKITEKTLEHAQEMLQGS
jgi:DNA repair protein RecN (Recombination protein N)